VQDYWHQAAVSAPSYATRYSVALPRPVTQTLMASDPPTRLKYPLPARRPRKAPLQTAMHYDKKHSSVVPKERHLQIVRTLYLLRP
jgi:hypothetical protein